MARIAVGRHHVPLRCRRDPGARRGGQRPAPRRPRARLIRSAGDLELAGACGTYDELLALAADGDARRRRHRHPHAADRYRRGHPGRRCTCGSRTRSSAWWCSASTPRPATPLAAARRRLRGPRLPAEGPRRRRRRAGRGHPQRGRGRVGDRPEGRRGARRRPARRRPLAARATSRRASGEILAEMATGKSQRGHRQHARPVASGPSRSTSTRSSPSCDLTEEPDVNRRVKAVLVYLAAGGGLTPPRRDRPARFTPGGARGALTHRCGQRHDESCRRGPPCVSDRRRPTAVPGRGASRGRRALDGFDLVGEASSGEEAVELSEQLPPRSRAHGHQHGRDRRHRGHAAASSPPSPTRWSSSCRPTTLDDLPPAPAPAAPPPTSTRTSFEPADRAPPLGGRRRPRPGRPLTHRLRLALVRSA